MAASPFRRSFCGVVVLVLVLLSGNALAQASQENSLSEAGLGLGVMSTEEGRGPLIQGHARFAAWRTIGLGVYAGWSWIGDDFLHAAAPIDVRLNLSLPFWRSFEPVLGIGAGVMVFRVENSVETKFETTANAQAAFDLMFPMRRRGLGLEVSALASGAPRYPTSESSLSGTLALICLLR